MAVAQDLPSLENREQYQQAENSVVYDAYGNKLATLTNNQGRILLDSERDRAGDEGGRGRDRGPALLRAQRRRLPGHRPRRLAGRRARARPQQGASTITQQFVKNALAAQDSRTVFQKLRESALAYHLERQWSKDKILTEYLNEIYFGEGATGIEAAAKTYFGLQPPGLRRERGRRPLRLPAAALGGGAARRDHLLAERLLAARLPRERDRAPRPGARQHARPGLHHAGGVRGVRRRSRSPTRRRSRRRPRTPPPPTSPPGCASSSSTATAPARPSAAACRSSSTLDLELQNRVQAIIQSTLAGIEPTASAVVLDNETGGVLAMVGGSDYQDSPFNLATNGHRQPGSAFKPFTLVTALEQGRSTGEVFTSAPQEIPFQVKVPKKNGNGDEGRQRPLRRQQLRRLLPRLGLDRRPATTYSDNSVYSQLGTQVGVENVAATADEMGIETDLVDRRLRVLDQRRPLAAVQPGADPRRPETGVTPLEMAHAYNTLAADGQRLSGHDGRRAPAARSGSSRSPTARTYRPSGDPVPDQTGASGDNELVAKQVIDPTVAADRQGRALDRGHLRHRPARPERRADLGQDRDHRRQRRRLVLRRDARRSPPASGSATATR